MKIKRAKISQQQPLFIDTSTWYTQFVQWHSYRVLWYMKPIHGLPGPRGLLSASVPSRAIAKANKGVREEVMRQAGKQGPYVKLSSSWCCEIAKYAGQHGTAETARHFFEEERECVSESTVKSIKKAYIEVQ